MRKIGKRLLALFLTLILIVSLAPVQAQAAKAPAVKKVTLKYKEYVLKKGEKLRLKATVTPKSAKGKVSWKSNNRKVATVTNSGVVQAKASKGKAVITVTAGKKRATCKITVGTPVKKITASNLKLTVGQSAQVSAAVFPKKATVKRLIYKSNKPSVVSVNNKGKVKALKSGSAKITILAADCSKVKKVISVTSANKNSETPTPSPTPTPTPTPDPNPNPPTPDVPMETPKFSISLDQQELSLQMGEKKKSNVTFTPMSEVTDRDIVWSSTDDSVAAVVSAQGDIVGLTPGTATVTAVSQQDARVSASMKVTVSEEGVVTKEVASGQELTEALNASTGGEVLLTLKTRESQITIPEGTYENITLVVDAPEASIDNSAQFKQVVIKEIAEDTWCEKSGNKIYMDSSSGHLKVDAQGRPNVYLLDGTESITVDNNANLQEILIASAAKVLVKGNSTASPIKCEYYNGSEDFGQITTYVPLDIYSTTKYKLVVGPGGEQTAVKASGENDVPEINGLGVISVTIDSTGENKTVIAENSGDLADLPTTRVSGRILKEKEETEGTMEATVYLVRYSMNITNDNISVYLDGSSTRKTETDDVGGYAFESVSIGNYVVVVEAEGYQLITQNIYIDNNYNEDRAYEVSDIILMDEAGRAGAVNGVLIDASTGNPIGKGLTVILRKGINNITTNEVGKVISDEEGAYEFSDLTPGQYTIQVCDQSDEPEYMSVYENISVQAEATVTRNMTLSKILDSDKLRFVLTWDAEKEGVSADLDIHLYGPDPFRNTEYGVYFSDQNSWYGHLMDGRYVGSFANLDVDDKAYEGPETITVQALTKGQYKVFVQDYTNGGTGGQLYVSNPVVKIYKGSRLVDTVKMPQKTGGVWFVGSYNNDTGAFTVADEVYNGKPNTSVRAQIGKLLNQLTQFEVTDAEAFSQDQKLIEQATGNYLLKKTTDAQLADYLAKLQALLEKLKKAFIIEQIKVEGDVKEEYGYYISDHDLYSFSGGAEPTTGFEAVMKDAGTSYRVEKLEYDYGEDYYSDYSYRLILENAALGVSTNYYFDYYQSEEKWVLDIQDPGNTGWRREVYRSNYGYTGGNNSDIGRNLDIKLVEGVSVVSKEYATDAAEGTWTYGDEVDLVLHLKKDATGTTKDYEVCYKPLGAELLKITDTSNRIIEQERTGYWDWYDEDYTASYRVYGENKEMGTNWTAEVSPGASYKVFDPDEYYGEDYDDEKPETVMEVTNTNGAKQVYNIYYYEDTTDAEIVGIYDPDNMYTQYYEEVNSYGSRTYYTLYLQGMNSELGKNLQVHTKAGASAKVEYTTGSESWDYESSNAKITVTAANGKERIYYIVYGKSSSSCNIRGISSTENGLKKVYLDSEEEQYIYITGSEQELGADDSLNIKTNPGYTASYSSTVDDDYYDYDADAIITVTEEATGEQQIYYVSYKQDISGLRIRGITSAQSKIYSVDISNRLATASQTREKYYRIELIGEKSECPQDLQAEVPAGATASVTYADENWSYAPEYAAKISVANGTDTVMYLVAYQQDESGATIGEITDPANTYKYTVISNYSHRISLKPTEEEENPTEEVYMIYVTGAKETLGTAYQLGVPDNGRITSTIHKGEAGWNYISESTEHGYYDEETGEDVYIVYNYVDRVEVEASNGAKRIYLIAYAQDESGAVVSGIEDKENTYVNVRISRETSSMDLNVPEGEENVPVSEIVYLIYVTGNNESLGTGYQLTLPKGAEIASTIHKGEAGWNYSDESENNSYYDDEEDNWISSTYYYADRITVKASNGAERIYLIAYAQDERGATVSGITDTGNEYVHTEISGTPETLALKTTEEEETAFEEVYMIYVTGNNESLGTGYQLTLPEGAEITSTVRKGETGWNYLSEAIGYGYDDEEDNWISNTYYYADRVTVKASNGAERIYVIAYASNTPAAE